MNFLNIFEDHVAGIFGATRAPFSFKKLAKQAARDMEDQTLVINGVNTAPALYTILIAADDDPMLAPFYPELSREVREFVKAQAEKRRYVFVGEPLVRFMIDPQLRAGKFSVFAENVDAPTLGRLYEEERAYQNGLGQNNSAASRAASAPRAGKQQFAAPQQQHPAAMPQQPTPRAAAPDPLAVADPFAPNAPDPAAAPIPVPQTVSRDALAGMGGAAATRCRRGPWRRGRYCLQHGEHPRPAAPARPARRCRERREPQHHFRAGDHRSRAFCFGHRPARPQRVAPPRPAHLYRFGLVDRGPQFHQRHARQQPPHHALPAAQRRSADVWPEHL